MKASFSRALWGALLAAAVFLSGCAAQTKSLLAYQSSLASVELEEGGRTWQITPVDGGFSAVITAPEAAAGIAFTVTESGTSASAGGITVPLGERMSGAVGRMCACLTLPEAGITDVRAAPEEGCRVLTFTDGTLAAVGDDGMPLWFERSGIRYTVRSIELTGGSVGDEASPQQ